jgi:hypothetical protein
MHSLVVPSYSRLHREVTMLHGHILGSFVFVIYTSR